MPAIEQRGPSQGDTTSTRAGAAMISGAASGALYVVLILVGNSLAEEGAQESLGVALEMVGFVALACFVAYVATVLRGARGWTTGLALVGGVTALGVKLGSAAPYLAARDPRVTPDAAVALTAINDAAFVVTWLPHGLFVVGLALAGRATGRIGRVIAATGVVIGLGCVAAVPFEMPVPFLLSLLWLIVVSVVLARYELREARASAVEI